MAEEQPQFNEVELNLLSIACLSAALMSRQAGHNSQATEFHWLADKCEVLKNGISVP